MPSTLETSVTYISDLNPAWPDGSGPKNEGDDHIRNTKEAIVNTFSEITGAVTASHTELNLLTGKTDVATAADIAAAALSASIPGVNDPANADKFLKGGGVWSSIDLRGSPAVVKADSGTTAQVLNYTQGEGQTIKATGSHSWTVTGFPVGRLAAMIVRHRDYGAFANTTTGITWIKSDGTETTDLAAAGITFRASGYTHVLYFSYGDGVIYAKAA